MPTPIPGLRLPDPDHRAYLDFMPESEIPVIRQPFQEGDLLPYWSANPQIGDHHLYKLKEDPTEMHNLLGDPLEEKMLDLLHTALCAVKAPEEQFARLGLKGSN